MKIRRVKIERVIITGKIEERDKAHDYVDKHKYQTRRTGPMFVKMGVVDLKRFKIIADRKI